MIFRPTRNTIAFAICALSVAGCGKDLPAPEPNLVKSVFEAGKTNVSVLSVRPWDEAKKALAVNFQIDAQKALNLALPRNSAKEERLLDALSVQLGIGLPQSGTTLNRQTNLADGSVSGTRRESETPGQAPGVASPAGAAANRTLDNQPRLSEDQRTAVLTADDPILRYQTANAIYQFVQLVNGMVENTPQVDDYTPYLVTLQVSSLPYARHQPYDVYLDMSFYPYVEHHVPQMGPCGTRKGSIPVAALDALKVRKHYKTPIVVPLLVTDNIEGQIASRSAELIRQIGLAGQAVQSGIGASFGLSSFNARAGSVFGTDLTSTFTVGKSTENGMIAVLGAPRNPVSDYAMTRRTHNVSVLLLVPSDIAKAEFQWAGQQAEKDGVKTEAKPLRRLQVIFTTDLRRPDEVGGSLASGKKGLRKLAISKITQKGLEPNATDLKNSGKRLPLMKVVQKLIPYIPTGDYPGFLTCLHALDPNYGFSSALYHTLADLYGRSPLFRSTAIPLPKIRKPKNFSIATDQAAAALDDQNTGRMEVTLTGAGGSTPRDLTGTLTLTTNDGKNYPFVATASAREGSKLTFAFKSPVSWGLADLAPAGGHLVLAYTQAGKRVRDEIRSIVYQAAPKRNRKDKPKNLTRASAVISAESNGGLKINLTEAASTKP